jgi:hypothetical protein
LWLWTEPKLLIVASWCVLIRFKTFQSFQDVSENSSSLGVFQMYQHEIKKVVYFSQIKNNIKWVKLQRFTTFDNFNYILIVITFLVWHSSYHFVNFSNTPKVYI